MTKITFKSPGEMIGAGIGILILGIILLEFGIGFIGAIFGIWWIIKGIIWHFKLSSNNSQSHRYSRSRNSSQSYNYSGSSYDPNRNIRLNNIKERLNLVSQYTSQQNFIYAAKELDDIQENFKEILKPEARGDYLRQASVYSILANDLNYANDLNLRGNTIHYTIDFLNINGVIAILTGNHHLYKKVDQQLNNFHPSERGQFNDFFEEVRRNSSFAVNIS